MPVSYRNVTSTLALLIRITCVAAVPRRPCTGCGFSVYLPGGRLIENLPSASLKARLTEFPAPSTKMISAPLTGRSAQPGSGGMRSTGQVGPANTVPVTTKSRSAVLEGPHEVPAAISAAASSTKIAERRPGVNRLSTLFTLSPEPIVTPSIGRRGHDSVLPGWRRPLRDQ